MDPHVCVGGLSLCGTPTEEVPGSGVRGRLFQRPGIFVGYRSYRSPTWVLVPPRAPCVLPRHGFVVGRKCEYVRSRVGDDVGSRGWAVSETPLGIRGGWTPVSSLQQRSGTVFGPPRFPPTRGGVGESLFPLSREGPSPRCPWTVPPPPLCLERGRTRSSGPTAPSLR